MQQKNAYTGVATLEFLHDAVNYNRFLERELARFITPYATALDFGAGTGEFACRLAKRGMNIVAVEPDAMLNSMLSDKKIEVLSSIEQAENFARIYSLNVLEHIEDDDAALRDLYAKLTDEGALFLYVPAFSCLYSAFDRHLGHFRRYRKKPLVEKLQAAGFTVSRAEYADSLGFFCWFIMAKIAAKETDINPLAIKLFDRIIFPISRIIDRVAKPYFGKNLLIIATK